jgi:hypothetical protein
MVHVATGNGLDVVYDYDGDIQVLRGLMRHGSDEVIPLPEPTGLIEVLKKAVNECRASQFAADERTNDGSDDIS